MEARATLQTGERGDAAAGTVTLGPEGFVLEGRTLPLVAGSLHYWRLDPKVWPKALDEVVQMGLRMVSTYVPWAEHELAPGRFDFGEQTPRRDVRRFLDLCAERGLTVLLRPGPHVNAELTGFGFPARVLADPACQARSARGAPVLVPAPPRAFPAPSFASKRYLEETRRWIEAFAEVARPFLAPSGGPVVALQADNEAALFFRTGAFDQDYAEDAVAAFRAWLAARYGSDAAFAEAWGAPRLTPWEAAPPTHLGAHTPRELRPVIDWLRFKEDHVRGYVARVAEMLRGAGLTGVPLFHNFPMNDAISPVDVGALERDVDLVGIDLYHPRTQLGLVRDTLLTLAGTSRLPFVPELGVGAPWYLPSLSVEDARQLLLGVLAYGARAFNLYMVVDRDRWYGSPVSARGVRRDDVADFYVRVLGALARVQWHATRREAGAVLLSDRAYGRLKVATNPWDPVPTGLLRLLGFDEEASVGEDDVGYARPPALVAARTRRRLDDALRAARLAHVYADDSVDPQRLEARPLVCVASAGFLSEEMQRLLVRQAQAGATVVLGPDLPEEGEAGAPCDLLARSLTDPRQRTRPLPYVRWRCGAGVVVHVPGLDAVDAAALAALLDGLGRRLRLPRDPRIEAGPEVDALRHHGPRGDVIALVNRGEAAAEVGGDPADLELVDLATGARIPAERPVTVEGLSVRLLEVVG